MQNLNEIKTRLHAVEQTRKMTNAMSLLSTARMKKSMLRASYNREYYTRVRAAIRGLLEKAPHIDHPYLEKREVRRAAYIVIAGEKGMCGSYNANLLSFADSVMSNDHDKYIVSIGKMATEHFRQHGIRPNIAVSGLAGDAHIGDAEHVINALLYGYNHRRIDEINIIYTAFESPAVQKPAIVHLLPLAVADYGDVKPENNYTSDMLFEPSAEQVFSTIVPQYAMGLLFDVIAQSLAGEFCARMNAMQNATNNADDMIASLRMEYNTARQFAITEQIIEIVSGTQKEV